MLDKSAVQGVNPATGYDFEAVFVDGTRVLMTGNKNRKGMSISLRRVSVRRGNVSVFEWKNGRVTYQVSDVTEPELGEYVRALLDYLDYHFLDPAQKQPELQRAYETASFARGLCTELLNDEA